MKRFLYCGMVSLIMALGACLTPNKPGSGLYFFIPAAIMADNAPIDTVLTPTNFLELRSDGSYAQDFGRYNYGTWQLKDNRLYLTNQQHRTYIYLVDALTPTRLDLTLESGRVGRFEIHALPSSSPEKDPFSTFNNQWRIPARHKETDAEIKQRLYNHCQFWETYFTWAEDHEHGAINVKYIPTPLKIYGNGFGLKHFADLPVEWRSYFYDSIDCHTADTMIKHTFRRHDIIWPNTDNDLKKLISGTHQLQQWLK